MLNIKKLFFLILLGFFLCVPFFSNAAGLVPCGDSRNAENACTLCHLIIGIYNVITFGSKLLITVAALMIFIAGIMYVISSGNEASMTKAKGFLSTSLIGFTIVLGGWFIVNVTMWILSVDPNSVVDKSAVGVERKAWNKFECSTASSTAGATPVTSSGSGATSAGYAKACPDPNSTTPIDFSGAKADPKIKLSLDCDRYDFSNSYGIDPNILRVIAQIESNCGANKGASSAGACGMMQLLPATAGASCSDLINDNALSIKAAAKYISDNRSKHSNNTEKILAGYNGGYATTGRGPLAPSVDCPGSLKFQCCKNPMELSETIGYVWNGVGLYSKL